MEPDLRAVLEDLSYPADKWQIIACTGVYGFDSTTRRTLYRLPARRYRSPDDVAEALGPAGRLESGKGG
ncbi:DUF2795 domain-containing protein [Actinophytocola sp.]|uniref:DUF2795 domain-containing protein n=1 Tax=Actinophytocola sp. TaxID=1872138 RepID=UPI002D7E6FF5|nr:DUF2795 domain-containing protein [Actinophytocola sp.]HET9138333.1 DUF2795 domain-containing protein [Actinophytocola sp.]